MFACVCVYVCQDFAHFLCCCCSICWPFVPGCKQQLLEIVPNRKQVQQQHLWVLKHCESLGFPHCTQLKPKWDHKCIWYYLFAYSYVPCSCFKLYWTRTTASIVVGTNGIDLFADRYESVLSCKQLNLYHVNYLHLVHSILLFLCRSCFTSYYLGTMLNHKSNNNGGYKWHTKSTCTHWKPKKTAMNAELFHLGTAGILNVPIVCTYFIAGNRCVYKCNTFNQFVHIGTYN